MDRELPLRLATRLAEPRRNIAVRRRFEPDLSYGRQRGPIPDRALRAAVMMVLYPHHGQWHIPLTLRPTHMAKHAGQISFPGGMIEYGESSRMAALRELEEELGVTDVEVLGRLSEFYVFVSGFRVTPWVGALDQRPIWRPQPSEVAEVIEVPVAALLDPANQVRMRINRHGCSYSALAYRWQNHRIWGATSMMLSELLADVGDLLSDPAPPSRKESA